MWGKQGSAVLAVLGAMWVGALASLWSGVSAAVVAYGMLSVTALGLLIAAYYSLFRAQSPKDSHRNFAPTTMHHFEQSSILAKVCHELRTPLHNIMGLISLLSRDATSQTQRYYLQLVDEASQHLLNMVNGVLDFSKADTAMLSIRKSTTNLEDIVRQSLRTVAPQAYQKGGIEVVCRFAPDVPQSCETDGTRLCQVLINLLGNAIKFTPSGFIELKVSRPHDAQHSNGHILFEVIDSGAGIPADQLESVFEPYSQVDMTIVRKASGTGLGLTIVKQIVTLLGGEVGVSSVLKQGSTFWFTLPVAAAENQALSAPQWHQGLKDPPSVCVVSNGRLFRELAAETLAPQGARVTTASSFAEVPGKQNFYLISEDALTSTDVEAALRSLLTHTTPASIAVFLSPAALDARKVCEQLHIPYVFALPLVSSDILAAVTAAESKPSEPVVAALMQPSARSMRVLIADDLRTNQLILRSLLEDAGHHVTSVSDGDELVAQVRGCYEGEAGEPPKAGFDLIMTDIQMPRVDGIAAIKQIRILQEANNAQPIPIIAMTAHALEEERACILTAGASEIITKPFKPQDVERALTKVQQTQQPVD
jgi:signal transduction histidine kinase/CheY-like chemotaxis protein